MVVRLRRWEKRDASRLAEIYNQPSISESGLDFHMDIDEEGAIEAMRNLGDSLFCVELNGDAAGGIVFCKKDDIFRNTADLEYWMDEHSRNMGAMTNVLEEAVLTYARHHKDIVRIEAIVFADNAASNKVLETSGFEKVGTKHKAAYKNGSYKDINIYEYLTN